jgi:CHAT domain-containing protein
VEGLQRGFKMAGVRFLIMSLWDVPDKETTEFMERFYESWLEGNDIRDAFQSSQTVMKNKYKTDPSKWAAFVLVE